ncbi:Magnesium transporter CorA family protein [Hibiscus syriacus]|uniref:Magnesium transporter CorA family protein n=1 Tax=Hibiscus syriacus TaxID=106335 RepID=A0A6A2XRQ8_HIBSY|nr:Magnesium transporter CorA family protein [Hibiscus syriacus]
MRETQGPNTRVDGCPSNRGVRDSSEHSYGRSGSILNSCNELGKAAYKKENDSVAYMLHSASSKLHSTGQTLNEQLFPPSNFFDADYRRQSIGPGDVIDSSMPPSHRLQSSWVGSTVEHDIVKMDAVPPNSTIYQMKPSLATSDSKLGTVQELDFSDLNMTFESGKKSSQNGFDNEWAINETITVSDDIGGTTYSNQSNLHSNKTNLSSSCWSDNILVSESNVGWKNLSPNHVSSALASNKQIFTSDSGGPSEFDDDLHKDTSLPDSYRLIYERLESKFLSSEFDSLYLFF